MNNCSTDYLYKKQYQDRCLNVNPGEHQFFTGGSYLGMMYRP